MYKIIYNLNLVNVSIKFEDEKEIIVSLENDLEYTTESLCTTLSSFLGDDKKLFLSTEKENEVLLPNVKIVQRIFLNGQKYKNLKVAKLKKLKNLTKKTENTFYSSSNVHLQDYSLYKKEKDLTKDSNKDVQYSSHMITKDPYSYQPLSKVEGDYNSTIVNSTEKPNNEVKEVMYQAGMGSNEKEIEPLVNKDLPYSSTSYNDYTSNKGLYGTRYEPSQVNDQKKEKDELEEYKKKGYGLSDKEPTNATGSSLDNVIKNIPQKYSSEKRNFRPPSANPSLINIEDNTNFEGKKEDKVGYSSYDILNQIKKPTIKDEEGNNTMGFNTQNIDLKNKVNSMRNQLNSFNNDKIDPNMKRGYVGYKGGMFNQINDPSNKNTSQYQFYKKDFTTNFY